MTKTVPSSQPSLSFPDCARRKSQLTSWTVGLSSAVSVVSGLFVTLLPLLPIRPIIASMSPTHLSGIPSCCKFGSSSMGFSAAWSLFRLDAQYVFSHRHINIADSSNLLFVHRHMIWRLPWRMVCSRSHGHVNPVRLSCARTLSPSPSRPKTPRMSGQPRALVAATRLVLCSCYLYALCDMPLYALHESRRECSGPTTVHKQSTKCVKVPRLQPRGARSDACARSERHDDGESVKIV